MCNFLTRQFGKLFNRRMQLSDSRGAVMLEFMSVAPVIIALTLSVFEVGMAVDRYLTLTRISYEGARYGAAISGLEEDSFGPIEISDTTKKSEFHQKLQRRITNLLQENGFQPAASIIVTERENDRVKIVVSLPYQSFLNILGTLQLRVQSDAPYLFP